MTCPDCERENPCRTCGPDDSDVGGTKVSQRVQYLRRAHFALPKARIVVAEDSAVLADELSCLIRLLEEVMSVAVHLDPNG